MSKQYFEVVRITKHPCGQPTKTVVKVRKTPKYYIDDQGQKYKACTKVDSPGCLAELSLPYNELSNDTILLSLWDIDSAHTQRIISSIEDDSVYIKAVLIFDYYQGKRPDRLKFRPVFVRQSTNKEEKYWMRTDIGVEYTAVDPGAELNGPMGVNGLFHSIYHADSPYLKSLVERKQKVCDAESEKESLLNDIIERLKQDHITCEDLVGILDKLK